MLVPITPPPITTAAAERGGSMRGPGSRGGEDGTVTTMDSLSHVRPMFPGAAGYLNSATMGLPSIDTAAAVRQMLADWEAGRVDPNAYDHDVDRARDGYAAIAGVSADDVAIVAQ